MEKEMVDILVDKMTEDVVSGKAPMLLRKCYKTSIDIVVRDERKYSRRRNIGTVISFAGIVLMAYSLIVGKSDMYSPALITFFVGAFTEMIYLDKKARIFRRFIDNVRMYELARESELRLAQIRSIADGMKEKAEEEVRTKEKIHGDNKKPLRSKPAR